MAKTKISEFSSTPANNTDIDSINIAEGCAPSGINDAIRELMAQLKDFQTGAAGDSFNGPVGTSTAAAGAFTTLSASSTVSGTGFSNYLASPPAIGATAAAAVSATTLTTSSTVTHNGGTANGVAYLNGSKVLTTGSALTFDGSQLDIPAGSAAAPSLSTPADPNTGLFFPAADAVSLSVNGAEGVRLTSTGLGIGTSSPTSFGAGYTTLTISGSNAGIFQSKNTLGDTRLYASTSGEALVGSWTNTALKLYTNSTLQATIDSSGNVGIGTSSPAQTLQVANGNNYQLRLANTAGAQYYDIGRNGSDGLLYFYGNQSGANGFVFSGANGERARIDTSGNLLVGTTSAPNGTANYGAGFINSSNSRRELFLATSTTSANNLARFYNPNGEVGAIQVSGTATSYVTSSDYRLKNTIAPMTGALAKVALLKPCTYKWNADDSDGQGFIAHELQAVVPECVTGEKDAVDAEGNPQYQGIDTSFLVATLTAAIQEQQAIINAQQAALTALTARVEALEAK